MMRPLRLLPLLSLPFFIGSLVHCAPDGPDPAAPPPPFPEADGGTDPADAAPEEEPDLPLVPATKVDLLFVVDNSASMGDKQGLLGKSIGTVLEGLADRGISDIHVGVISTSLGGMGGDVCTDDDQNGSRQNDHAHLLGRKADGQPVTNAESGVLSLAKSGSLGQLITDVSDVIVGVGETGCGFEAQLESMYRFLVQPDPPASIALDATNTAVYQGLDTELLAQRRAFLRPDSAVAIVMVTDEDDSTVDPRTLGGQGWSFVAKSFPGSKVFRGDPRSGTTAPRATSACATDPTSAACTSCGLAATCDPSKADCQAIREDAECKKLGAEPRAGDTTQGYAGYYGPTEDAINTRFHRMKERFGIDPQFPLERYVRGLTSRRVPRRETEHDTDGNYVHAPTCVSPLFAAAQPAPGKDPCDMVEGTRSRQLVTFHLLGGLPPALAGKRASEVSWTKVVGANPDAYDTTGIDPHMIASVGPRAGLPPPSKVRGDNGTDPVHGREWDTLKNDLQYACTFALPVKRTCSMQDPSCECAMPDRNPPLCTAVDGEQAFAKAYPTLRQLRVAKALGERAVVSSLCALDTTRAYGPAFDLLLDRMTPLLAK